MIKSFPKKVTPEELAEFARLKQQAMDLIDPFKNHVRMERDRRAYAKLLRDEANQRKENGSQ